jgi:hypothetical protein
MKKLWNRESLKGFFQKGQLPTQVHFEYLIESTINKIDDGFNKTDANGLQLAPTGADSNVLSIFKAPSESLPSWQIGLQDSEKGAGLSFNSVSENVDGAAATRDTRLFLANNGNIGIGTTAPRTELDVNGTLGTGTRIGTYNKIDAVPGDGAWKDILTDLKGIQAFEVVASINGPSKRGKYAITHAIALSTFGGSRQKIRQTRAYFGWFWNRVEFRWHGEIDNFRLQVRTRTNYGTKGDNTQCMIRFHVTRLWDDAIFQQR